MKLRNKSLALLGGAIVALGMLGTPAAATASPVPVVASEVAVAAAPTPCDGPTNVRFTQYGPGLTTSKVHNCRTTTIKVQFVGNNAAGPSVEYSSCRTLAPGASTTIQDGLLMYWKEWRYC
jgi:hypothetical protein